MKTCLSLWWTDQIMAPDPKRALAPQRPPPPESCDPPKVVTEKVANMKSWSRYFRSFSVSLLVEQWTCSDKIIQRNRYRREKMWNRENRGIFGAKERPLH